MRIQNKLSSTLGLTDYEAKVFTALHSHGPLQVIDIARYSDIKRTAIYPPLSSLINKGFVSVTIFGKRKYYSAVSTETLKMAFEEKRQSLEGVISSLNETRNIESKESKLQANLYLGEQGIKSAGLLFLNETKDRTWYSFENITKIADSIGFDFEHFYIKERVKRGINSKMILSITDESPTLRKILKDDKKQLRETVMLSPHEYPFETTVVATKGLVLLINPNQGRFALLIRNAHLANTFINIHKCIWDRYKS